LRDEKRKPISDQEQQEFYHLACADNEIYEQYCPNKEAATRAIKELALFSWGYKYNFFTAMLIRGLEFYRMGDLSTLEAVDVFYGW